VSERESIHFQLDHISNNNKIKCDLCEPKFISRNPFKRKKGEKNNAKAKLLHEGNVIFTCDDCYHGKSIGQIIAKFGEKKSNLSE
jgi:hypothetical protein